MTKISICSGNITKKIPWKQIPLGKLLSIPDWRYLVCAALTLLMIIPVQAQRECQRYGKSFRKLQTLKSHQPRDEDKFRQESGVAALLLEQCFESRGHVSDEEFVETTYMLGKHFLDAGACSKASEYFQQCMENPASKKLSVNYFQKASDFSLLCRQSGHGSEGVAYRIVRSYSGKGGLTEQYFDSVATGGKADRSGYFSDEIEVLQDRIYKTDDSEAAGKSLKAISGASFTFYKKPFLLLLVSGDVSDLWSTSRLSNTVDTEMASQEKVREPGNEQYLEEFYRRHLEPTYNFLKNKYFDQINEEYIIPVYIFDHPFNNEGSQKFAAFCQRLHYKPAGNRVGYFNEYDKSLVTWINSGTGTFAHELVHALMHYDFPAAPLWLSEGIAAMYEESKNYRPLHNWRLVYIKTAYDKFGTFADMQQVLEMEGTKSNYQQLLLDAYSRYFCMFLEGEGLLSEIYREMRKQDGAEISVKVIENVLKAPLDTIQQDFDCYLYHANNYGNWNYDKYIRDVSRYTLKQPELPFDGKYYNVQQCKKTTADAEESSASDNYEHLRQMEQEQELYPNNQMQQMPVENDEEDGAKDQPE